MLELIQILINGISSGLTTAILATAFALVYIPTKIFFIALGCLFIVSPHIVWFLDGLGLNIYLSISIAMMVTIVLSVSFELFNHRQLEKSGATVATHLISSLGIYIVVTQVIVLLWGNQPKSIQDGTKTIFYYLNLSIDSSQILSFIISITVIGFFHIWLKFTNTGLHFRGIANNPVEMGLKGYNVYWFRIIAFGSAGLLASVASLLTAYDSGFEPHHGMDHLLFAIVAVIIGGQESFWGPVFGGIMLGIFRSAVVWNLSGHWEEAIVFFLLVVFLIFRPKGIIQHKYRLESDK